MKNTCFQKRITSVYFQWYRFLFREVRSYDSSRNVLSYLPRLYQPTIDIASFRTKFHSDFYYFPMVFLIRNQISFLVNLLHRFFCCSISIPTLAPPPPAKQSIIKLSISLRSKNSFMCAQLFSFRFFYLITVLKSLLSVSMSIPHSSAIMLICSSHVL
mgnify:CR=1 FL=1